MSNYRKELKYFITFNDFNIINNNLNSLLKKDKYCNDDYYQISSIYFDNYNMTSYNQVLNGKSKEPVYVDIEDACKFVNETKIDSLAPAVGNVHGLYTGKPKIDVEKIKKLQNILNIPLVLHGGTGIGDEELKQIIESGITKVNINTELQIAWTKAIKEYLNQNPDIYDPRKIIKSGEKAIKEAVRHKLQILS